jgi:hypothetical protein
MRAIDNVNGTGININYNTIKSAAGGAWTGIFGVGAMTNVTIDHNDIHGLNAPIDGIQLQFKTGRNVEIAYNKILDNWRFAIELQDVVDGLRVWHNYTTYAPGSNQIGQISVATGNEENGHTEVFPGNTYHVDIGWNIVKNDGYPNGLNDCFEVRGIGTQLHDNYCYDSHGLVDYDYTRNSRDPNTPWQIKNNMVISRNPGSTFAAMSSWEGYDTQYGNYGPTDGGGNTWYSLSNAPAEPAWPYPFGTQPNVP